MSELVGGEGGLTGSVSHLPLRKVFVAVHIELVEQSSDGWVLGLRHVHVPTVAHREQARANLREQSERNQRTVQGEAFRRAGHDGHY